MKKYDFILAEDGDFDWFIGKMAQDIAKTMPKPKKAKRVYQTKKVKSENLKHLHALKELQEWLDKYDDSKYDDYRLQVKAELDRVISKYFSSIRVNHARLRTSKDG